MTELVPPESFARDLAEIIDKAIDNAVDPLKSKIKALDEHITRLMLLSAKVAELQDRPELRLLLFAEFRSFRRRLRLLFFGSALFY